MTDGRFSGGSHGFIVGHITPEAQVGGPIGLIQDGDTITIDASENRLEVALSERRAGSAQSGVHRSALQSHTRYALQVHQEREVGLRGVRYRRVTRGPGIDGRLRSKFGDQHPHQYKRSVVLIVEVFFALKAITRPSTSLWFMPGWNCVLVAALALLLVPPALSAQEAQPPPATARLDRALLDQSLQLGTEFLLASQLPDGSFRYHVNFLTGQIAPEQSAVRQAGALWGLALVHQDRPSAKTRAGVLRGLAFFHQQSSCQQQKRFLEYPGTREGDSGAVALVTLALIDFLRTSRPTSTPSCDSS